VADEAGEGVARMQRGLREIDCHAFAILPRAGSREGVLWRARAEGDVEGDFL
jgi:hypothetical protein